MNEGKRIAGCQLRVALAIAGAFAAAAAGQQRSGASAESTGSAEYHLHAGTEAVRQDKFEQAVTEFQTALRLNPDLGVRARYPLAAALLKLNQSAAARQELEAVRREVGDRPDVRIFLAGLSSWIETSPAQSST